MASSLNHKRIGQDPLTPTTKTAASRLKDGIRGLPGKLVSSSSRNKVQLEKKSETELVVVGGSEWLVVESEDILDDDMNSTVEAAAEGSTNLTPNSFRKRTHTGNSKPHMSTPPLGPSRTSSTSGKGSRTPRPSSPHSTGTGPFQRKPSGRSSRSTNLEVENGESSKRSVSPSRVRNHSPLRGSSRTNSPNVSGMRSSSKKKGILLNDSDSSVASPVVHIGSQPSNVDQAGANGKSLQVATTSVLGQALAKNQVEIKTMEGTRAEGDASVSAFEKVRDTLRISRPKKKKKAKGKLAYSIVVDPAQMSTPEISLHEPDKYQDPFETSFAENGDAEKRMDHVFKPASIPHNKPEYCDHCGDMAWGLYRQVLKCSRCNFIAHRKCEGKVIIGCSLRLEQAILHHDKQVEDVERIAAREEVEVKTRKDDESNSVGMETDPSVADPPDPAASTLPSVLPPSPSPATPTITTPSSSTSNSTPASANSQLLMEKTKLSRKIREYNRKTTPVHHIHIKSTFQASDPNTIEYHGFVRVHMHVQRPIHVSTAITRTSWYRLMRPVKERTLNDVDGYELQLFKLAGDPAGKEFEVHKMARIQTAFYLPLDTNRLVHIQNVTTTKELIQILLKKFCVTDNPKKFSLYEEYSGDCRRLFEEDRPLEISLDASVSHRNSKLVLRDNTYSTIQWDAFSSPELSNFIQILHREEELYEAKLTERFELWKKCIQQALKDKAMEEIAKKTKKTVSSRLAGSKGRSLPKNVSRSPKSSHKSSVKKSVAKAS